MSLVRSTATIGFYTLISRVFGFIRDITIASGLGASMLSDAFFVSFKIPNFLRRLFAEGAFNSAFVPMFSGMLAAEGKEAAKSFADEAMSFLFAVLLVVSVFFIAFMPWLMVVLAPGFSDDPTKYDLTVTLTRITFPYIIFISLVSLMGGILNSFDKFAAVAATPIIMNLCLILLPPLFAPFVPSAAHALSCAVMAAGVAQFLWLVYFCCKLKVMPSLRAPRLSAQVKRLLVLIMPAAMGAGVAQINLFVDLIIASHIDNAVSYLYYADRINELPLAVIGIAVGTALLPMLSRQIREGKHEVARHSQNRAIELALLLSLPAAIAIMVISEPIIRVMFERGRFTALDTAATHIALVAFAAGLPAFILVKVLSPAFYANQDTKTPFKIALVCIFTNFCLNLILIWPFKHVGMAMATTIAGWLNVVLMLHNLKKRELFTIDRALVLRTPRIMAASVTMAVVLYLLQEQLWPYFSGVTVAGFASLIGMSVGGFCVYALACFLLKAVDREMIRRIRQRGKTPPLKS